MAYEPTEWKSGDVVTSAKLNKLEQAVAGCSLVVHATTEGDVKTLDKTWQEIFDAFSAGASVVVVIGETEAHHVQKGWLGVFNGGRFLFVSFIRRKKQY